MRTDAVRRELASFHQRIGGHVIHAGLDGGVDRAQQVVVGLPRRSVDQIEADVLEARGERVAQASPMRKRSSAAASRPSQVRGEVPKGGEPCRQFIQRDHRSSLARR